MKSSVKSSNASATGHNSSCVRTAEMVAKPNGSFSAQDENDKFGAADRIPVEGNLIGDDRRSISHQRKYEFARAQSDRTKQGRRDETEHNRRQRRAPAVEAIFHGEIGGGITAHRPE